MGIMHDGFKGESSWGSSPIKIDNHPKVGDVHIGVEDYLCNDVYVATGDYEYGYEIDTRCGLPHIIYETVRKGRFVRSGGSPVNNDVKLLDGTMMLVYDDWHYTAEELELKKAAEAAAEAKDKAEFEAEFKAEGRRLAEAAETKIKAKAVEVEAETSFARAFRLARA